MQSLSARSTCIAAAMLIATSCGGSPASGRSTASPASTSSRAGTDVNGTLQSGRGTRSYVVHLPPAQLRLTPTPVVIAFHGFPMTSGQMMRITHLSAVADEHGFAVLFPQGYQNSWAVPGGSTPAQQAGIDDVAFVRALLDSVGQLYRLDTSHVVATGISNGGILTQLLGCSLADRLIGIAPVAGLMRRDTETSCTPARRVSVFEIHGVDDPIAAYTGVPGADGFLSFADTLAFWAGVDGCSKTPMYARLADTAHDSTSVATISYSSCGSGAEVTGYAVNGGGHAWPGGEPIGGTDDFGVSSHQFDASELIWSFLDRLR